MATLLVAICFISFLLIKNSPIDPIQAYIGADMLKVGPEQREKIAEYWGLNQPIMVQFLNWGSALLTGDMGTSMIFRRPVSEIISERFFHSLALMLTAWVLSGIIGFAMGVIAAMKKTLGWTESLNGIVTHLHLLLPFGWGFSCSLFLRYG